jgi:predicted nucleic acid-binding protein
MTSRDAVFADKLARWLTDFVLAGFEARILPFDLEIASATGRLATADKRRCADAMIAATAIVLNSRSSPVTRHISNRTARAASTPGCNSELPSMR